MSIKKLLTLIGICSLMAACSSGKYSADYAYRNESPKKLGVRYLLGRGVAKDNERAFYYFHQAANQEDPFALNELAYMYAAGKGTRKDLTKALIYYQKAANQGLASAQYNLGFMYLHGLGTKPNKEMAIKWFQKSADHGFEPARLALDRYA